MEERRFRSGSANDANKQRKKKISVQPGKSLTVTDLTPGERSTTNEEASTSNVVQSPNRSAGSASPPQVPVKNSVEPSAEISSSGDSDNESNEITEDTLTVFPGDFVIFLYDNVHYPGEVLKKKKQKCLIKSMEKSGLFQWKWPKCDDILWYNSDDVKEFIAEPEFSKRGLCKIPEMEKYL